MIGYKRRYIFNFFITRRFSMTTLSCQIVQRAHSFFVLSATLTMGTLQLVGGKKSYCFHFNSQIIIYVIICPPTRAIISFGQCQRAIYSHCGNIEVIISVIGRWINNSMFCRNVDFDSAIALMVFSQFFFFVVPKS